MADPADIQHLSQALDAVRTAGEYLAKLCEQWSMPAPDTLVKSHRRRLSHPYRLKKPSMKEPTYKKAYVMNVRHIQMIEAYAHEHRMELKEVMALMCESFFAHD